MPVTSPDSEPVKLVAEPAVVAFPSRSAVTTPAEKFPDASLLTRVEGASASVAALARATPKATDAAVCPPTRATEVAD